ncbi:hypothetical protein TMPK1_35200 [Rhodospirillales bacterium TMPK1]|uniref:Uncharacterized protein n=1 Tax=Roseiterribacter gracilis TaxID=2812848 RepID=A0A8S8XCT6_9PROT|nr:hypothetical protein TMPK1_35200 [Rhodospirillales bacterium TMPK1]
MFADLTIRIDANVQASFDQPVRRDARLPIVFAPVSHLPDGAGKEWNRVGKPDAADLAVPPILGCVADERNRRRVA